MITISDHLKPIGEITTNEISTVEDKETDKGIKQLTYGEIHTNTHTVYSPTCPY